MGLDAVELIMSWEEAFGVHISDDEAEVLQTPKMAIDLISDKVEASDDGVGVCPVMRSYHCIRQAFQSVLGLQRGQIKLDSKLRFLIPKNQRQEAWNQIHSYLGIPKFPSLSFGVGVVFNPITVQDLVDWTVARYHRYFINTNEGWTKAQVRSVVRAVVRDVVGVSKFKDESDFYGEIGID